MNPHRLVSLFVTIVAAAAANACGGSVGSAPGGSGGQGGSGAVAGSGGGTSGSGGLGGSSGVGGTGGTSGGGGTAGLAGSGGTGGAPGCPAEPVPAGSPCSPNGLTCQFPPCLDAKNTVEEQCVQGVWEATYGSTCFPTCPPVEPHSGDVCSFSDGFTCSYQTDPCCGPDQATCVGRKWQLTLSACAGLPACPATLPQAGSQCSTCDSTVCGYDVSDKFDPGDTTCGSLPLYQARCVSGAWMISSCTFDGGPGGG